MIVKHKLWYTIWQEIVSTETKIIYKSDICPEILLQKWDFRQFVSISEQSSSEYLCIVTKKYIISR